MSTAVGAETTSAPPAAARLRRAGRLRSAAPFAALVVLTGAFAVTTPAFTTGANFLALTEVVGPLLLTSLGATFVIIAGGIDLSVGSTAMLAGSIAALLLGSSATAPFAILAVVVTGLLCGTLNGAIVTLGRVPSFIVTLGALSVYRGIGLKLINGSPIPFTNALVSTLAIGQAVPSVANVALWSFATWVVAWFVCFKTRFGLYIYAIGGSERVARLAGIAVDRWKIAAFALSGATAAIAGLFSVGQLGSADPTLGSSFLLDSLAAIVVGGTSLSGGIGGVQRTLLGVLVISILDDGLNLRGVDEFTAEIVKGVVVVVAAMIVMINRRDAIVK